MALSTLIAELATELNDTMTTNNGGTVMVSLAAALHGGLGNGKTSTSKYLQEADHIADVVFPAVKGIAHGGGASGNHVVTIAYIHAAVPVTVQYTGIMEFQADFSANFATYYPALAVL